MTELDLVTAQRVLDSQPFSALVRLKGPAVTTGEPLIRGR